MELSCPALLVQATYEKLLTEVPKYKMITPSVLSDRLRVRLVCSQSRWEGVAWCSLSKLPAGREQRRLLPWLGNQHACRPSWRSPRSSLRPTAPALLPQINGSLARAAIKELLGKGLIKEVAKSRAQQVCCS